MTKNWVQASKGAARNMWYHVQSSNHPVLQSNEVLIFGKQSFDLNNSHVQMMHNNLSSEVPVVPQPCCFPHPFLRIAGTTPKAAFRQKCWHRITGNGWNMPFGGLVEDCVIQYHAGMAGLIFNPKSFGKHGKCRYHYLHSSSEVLQCHRFSHGCRDPHMELAQILGHKTYSLSVLRFCCWNLSILVCNFLVDPPQKWHLTEKSSQNRSI